jgi:hypothetical protein
MMNEGINIVTQKFTTSLPTYNPLFSSQKAVTALERTIALHFLRTGQFTIAETFFEVGNNLLATITLSSLSVFIGTRNPGWTYLLNYAHNSLNSIGYSPPSKPRT